MRSFKSAQVIDDGKSIILRRTDGSTLRYHSTWLRDNALDSKTEIEITTRIIKLLTDRILICNSHNMLMGKFYSKMINLSD